MGFWKNVDDYLKYKVISRKELSAGTGIKAQTIDRAIQRDSEPTLTEGLEVCKFLKLNPSDLLDSPITLQSETTDAEETKKEIKLYRKYHELIQNCEYISQSHQNVVCQLAKSLAESSPEYKSSK